MIETVLGIAGTVLAYVAVGFAGFVVLGDIYVAWPFRLPGDKKRAAVPASAEAGRWDRYIAGDPVNRSEWDGTAWEATRER